MTELATAHGNEFSASDLDFMKAALKQAQIAKAAGEVPVGCVLVRDGVIVSEGYNQTNETRNGTRHAEMVAFDKLLDQHGGDVPATAIPECDLYVTCEPCIMCAGALSILGIRSVVYGCPNDKFGGNGSIVPVNDLACGGCGGDGFGKPYVSRGGLCADEAVKLLQDFYIAGNPHAPKPHRPLLQGA